MAMTRQVQLTWMLIGVGVVLRSARKVLSAWQPFPYALTVTFGLVLGFAVVFAFVAMFSEPEPKWSSLATLLFALALYCVNVSIYFALSLGFTRVLGTHESVLYATDTLEKIHELRPEAARLAGSLVYNELGVRVGYRSEDGSALLYEPSSKEVAKRREKLKQQSETLKLREDMADQSRSAQLQVIVYLGCLPVAALAVAAAQFRRRKKVS